MITNPDIEFHKTNIKELTDEVQKYLLGMGTHFNVGIVGFYDEISKLIRQFILSGVFIADIELSGYYDDNYVDEFYLTITVEPNNKLILDCEPAKRDDQYLDYVADKIYLYADCHHHIEKYCDSSIAPIVYIESN